MCLKRLKTSAFGSPKPLLFLRLNGRVGAIPTYRVYRLYDIHLEITVQTPEVEYVCIYSKDFSHLAALTSKTYMNIKSLTH